MAGTEPRHYEDGAAGEVAETEDRQSTHNLQPPTPEPKTENRKPTAAPFWIAEGSIGSERLWALVVERLSERGIVRPADVLNYLAPAVLLSRTGERTFRVGVPHDLARQRIEHKWRGDLEAALRDVLGGSGWELEVQVTGERRRSA
jgi:hypothetical protein